MLETLSAWCKTRKGERVGNYGKDSFYFQKDAFVEKFRPLTYYEIVTGKPLVVPIPNSKFIFRANMQSVTTVVRFNEILGGIINPIVDEMGRAAKETAVASSAFTADSTKLIQGCINIARVLWEFTDKPKWFWTKGKMWKAFLKACLDDSDYLFGLLNMFRDYNQRFFFTLKYLRNYPLIQSEKWKPMDFKDSSVESAESRIKRRSFLHLRGTKLMSQARQSHMN